MKSLDHQSTSLSSSVSSQSPANSGSAGTSFNKFSRSNGYYSQVLRVSWNIIGMRGCEGLKAEGIKNVSNKRSEVTVGKLPTRQNSDSNLRLLG